MPVIISSDDYGLNESISRATLDAIDRGLCSSTSMMANGLWSGEAASLICEKTCSVGIHLNLTFGLPLTSAIRSNTKFCDADGLFRLRAVSVATYLSGTERTLVANELREQIRKVRSFGVSLSHADSHHHIHTFPALYGVCRTVLREQGIRRLRLAQNLGLDSLGAGALAKVVYRDFFNRSLRKTFVAADYFCDLTTYRRSAGKIPQGKVCEIMVHADFDSLGCLIDRRTQQSEALDIALDDAIISYNDL